MLRLCITIISMLSTATAWAAGPAPVILAASATSSSPKSTSVACLLDPSCDGHWSPGAQDSGVDEGIYIQFEKPISGASIELYSPGALDNLRIYINGKTGSKDGAYSVSPAGITTKATWVDQAAHRRPGSLGKKFDIQVGYSGELPSEKIKSIFLKVDKFYGRSQDTVTINAIRFVNTNGAIMDPVLPRPLPATASATSVLSPDTAYQPANLVDSRYDIAWSTDGKKNDGRGESVTFDFSKPVSVSGLMVWNGYQRSNEHFKANGRVKSLRVSGGTGTSEVVALQDSMTPQRILLARALPSASRVTLTIVDIVPGDKYRDVLLSELRFLDDKGAMIQPVVPFKTVTPPAAWKPLIDNSFSVILHHPMTKKEADTQNSCCYQLSRKCDNARIRIRSNGTFVIYRGFDFSKKYNDSPEAPANVDSVVMEGNWEPVDDKIRIFGRQYKTALVSSEYLTSASPSAPRSTIFQSELSLSSYGKISPTDRNKLLQSLWQRKRGPGDGQEVQWGAGVSVQSMLEDDSVKNGEFGGYDITAANYRELARDMDHFLTLLNPHWIHSSVFDDLVVPTDGAITCESHVRP